MDEHAHASGGAKTGEATGEAPDRVLCGGELGREVKREHGHPWAVAVGRAGVRADGNFLTDVLGAGANDAGERDGQWVPGRGDLTGDAGGGAHELSDEQWPKTAPAG